MQELIEDNFGRKLECEIMTDNISNEQILPSNIMFTDKASITLNGVVNRHISQYWSSQTNAHWYRESHTQRPQKFNLWAGILDNQIIGQPFVINGNLNGNNYHDMLQDQIVRAVNKVVATTLNPDGTATFDRNEIFFQQDGAPPHYQLNVSAYLNQQFLNRWIRRRGAIEWPARSPDLNLWTFLFGAT